MADNEIPRNTSGHNISDETVQRMVELVRGVAKFDAWSRTRAGVLRDEARAILAELPKPVDPAVLAVREILDAYETRSGLPMLAKEIWSGARDNTESVSAALAAFKRVTGGGA